MSAERCTEYCAHRGCPRRATQQTRAGAMCKKCFDKLPSHLRRLDTRRKPSPAPAGGIEENR